MSRTRVVVGLLALVLGTGGWLAAQDKKGDDKKDPPAKFRNTMPKYWTKLGLSDEQKQRIYQVQSDVRPKIEELRAKIKELEATEKREREKVLTDGQKARLKELIEAAAGLDSGSKKEDKPKKDEKKPEERRVKPDPDK